MILIIDDMAIFREPIAACLRLAGLETDCAVDGIDGLAKARQRKPELILLDMAMPRMNGLSFLRAMQSDPQLRDVPVIALTAVAEKDYIISARELKVCEYLLKSRFRASELVERIQKHLPSARSAAPHPLASGAAGASHPGQPAAGIPATAVAQRGDGSVDAPAAKAARSVPPKPLGRDEVAERTRKAVGGSTLAGVVSQVLTLTSSPRGDMAQLAALIGRDSMLSAGVLTAANSAAYTSGRGVVGTIPDAVRQVGCTTVRNIAAGLGIFDAIPRTAADGFNPIRCWQHSFAVAQLCELLAQPHGHEEASVAYIVGLCHDLPQIIFRTQFEAECQQVLAAQAADPKRPRSEVEQAVFGMSERQILLTVVESLGLPVPILRPIHSFHERGRGSKLADILYLAEHYANGLLLGSGEESVVTAYTRARCRAATTLDDPSCPDGQQFRCEVLGLTGTLARLTAEEQRRLMAPLYPLRSARLYLVRHPSLSSFDPVAAALASMAQLEVASALPAPQALSEFDGLVVLSPQTAASAFTREEILRCMAKKPLPLLWLGGRDDAGDRTGTPQRQVLPIGIDQISKFVDEAEAARGSASRAA